MKRLSSVLVAFVATICAVAQTNFRQITYQEALAASKAEGKPVFIDFYTSWCGPCKAMAKNIFPLKKVGDYMNATYVCIKLDAEKEGAAQAKLYKIDAYPTMVVVDSDGKELYRKVGGSNDGSEFVSELKVASNPLLSPMKMQERYEAGDRDAELISAYATYLYKRAYERRTPNQNMLAMAQKIVDDYYNSLTDAQRMEEKNFFVFSYSFCSNPKQTSARFLIDNKDKFPADMKAKVDEAVDDLLRYRMGTLMMNQEAFTHDDIEVIKEAVAKTGLGTKDEFVPTFKTLEAILQGDEAYFATVVKYLDKMNKSDRAHVIAYMGDIIKSTDKALCQKANKWLRSKLATMSSNELFYVATTIRSFEKRINPEAFAH